MFSSLADKYRIQIKNPSEATLAAWRLEDQRAEMIERIEKSKKEKDDDDEIAIRILSSIIK